MANMSYCRFQNTAPDLQECYENFSDIDELSAEEKKARRRIIKLAVDIALDFGHEVGPVIIEEEGTLFAVNSRGQVVKKEDGK